MARTIVVTGAASGIGKSTAEQLEAAGDTVIRVDLREGDVTGDLGDPASVDRVAAEIAERTGGVLDGLVANAGVSAPRALSVTINYLGHGKQFGARQHPAHRVPGITQHQ